MMRDDEPVDFGHQKVTPAEKTRRVGDVFRSVAQRYDVMNDLMSLGSHRLMKRMTVEMSGARAGHRILDLAGGTGDLSALYSPVVGAAGMVVLADINGAMMQVGRDRLLDRGLTNVKFCEADAQALPFADASFNCVTIAFGLRNVTDKERALAEMHRVLCPGGRLLVLEFSRPENSMVAAAYGLFQSLWPAIGQTVTGDANAYRYLVESIEVHPSQKALKLMIGDAGFKHVDYHNLLNGVVAIHHGDKTVAT
jgi:demethylmenaquinone methyltransferase/2-methoxy-6-polyprenyl-1,4-benzoquinol methylase